MSQSLKTSEAGIPFEMPASSLEIVASLLVDDPCVLVDVVTDYAAKHPAQNRADRRTLYPLTPPRHDRPKHRARSGADCRVPLGVLDRLHPRPRRWRRSL